MIRKIEIGVLAIGLLIFILDYTYDGFTLSDTNLFLLIAVVTGVSALSAYKEGKNRSVISTFCSLHFVLSPLLF
ncbi:hypothetical protein [Piscibacillus salipiscarius]|uniref:hypothetical protein n=1 Tax=Piscibacillus salipiscarius TaxID=299480 RepID=UPI0006D27362|nr:hypothetical protein [Piscibacillus salipiscarius]